MVENQALHELMDDFDGGKPKRKVKLRALPPAPERNESLRAGVIILLCFVSVLVWSVFVPVVDLDPDTLFIMQGEGNIFSRVFNLNFALFLILSPLTYALVAAFGIKNAGKKGLYCAIGVLIAILISFFAYGWPLYYLVTGVAYAVSCILVYKMAAVKFVELTWWNSFRACNLSIGSNVNYVLLVLVFMIGFHVFPQQDLFFQKSIYNMLEFATPSEEGQVSASEQFSKACFGQLIDELKKPVSRDVIIQQLEGDASYLALPTQALKDEYVDRAVSASDLQKSALVAQLESAQDADLNAASLPSRDEAIQGAYESVVRASPMIQEIRRYFGLFFVLSVWFTVIMFKVFIGLFGAVYGYLFFKLFETGGMF